MIEYPTVVLIIGYIALAVAFYYFSPLEKN